MRDDDDATGTARSTMPCVIIIILSSRSTPAKLNNISFVIASNIIIIIIYILVSHKKKRKNTNNKILYREFTHHVADAIAAHDDALFIHLIQPDKMMYTHIFF